MSCLMRVLSEDHDYQKIIKAIEKNRLPLGVLGLSHIHKAHLTACLSLDPGKNALIITPDEAQADRLVQDLLVMGLEAHLFKARDFSFRPTQGRSREYEHSRLKVLGLMAEPRQKIIVSSVEAAMQYTLPPPVLSQGTLTLKTDDNLDVKKFLEKLVNAGFVATDQVEGPGQFALRGGIIDVFSPVCEYPYRIELWGDLVDSIHFFDTENQRSTENIGRADIAPAGEVLFGKTEKFADSLEEFANSLKGKGSSKAKLSLLGDVELLKSGVRLSSYDRYLPLVFKKPATLFDYAEGYLLFVIETFSVKERAEGVLKILHEDIKAYFEEGVLCKGLDNFTLSLSELFSKYELFPTLYLDNLPRGSFDTPVKDLVNFNARQLSPWNGSFKQLLEDIGDKKGLAKERLLIFAGNEKSALNLSRDLSDAGIENTYYPDLPNSLPLGSVCLVAGSLSAGFEYPLSNFRLITYNTGRAVGKKSSLSPDRKKGAFFSSLEELVKGSYVVHSGHGIGIYEGIVTLEANGTVKDYIKIKYDKGDILYVPVTQLDQVTKYIGPRSEDAKVKLNRLGGKEWQKTQTKVKAAVKDMANQLIDLYAKRQAIKGYAFSSDIDMQNDFELRFEFQETPDQLRCVHEIKRDMEKPYPMDRLLCGDVGFGKTEVALRAAFKCIADGKQCALLVPTTILALQHFQTINKRFEGFPIETGMLSRFRTPAQIKKTIAGLRRGNVDIVVGTHRLISKDVEFRDLGLIIIDEEQRFGVAQKERLKELFPAVDVLTLTATPIPRTLNMAMSGIRDMSVLEEAPQDRLPVQTYVIEHDPGVLSQAMAAELRRGGQVYYLYNRVENIASAALKIRELLPEARVAVAHGQMNEDELSDTWRALLENEIDILVCTTIIETGVDVPNVNTLIIEDADRMGLAQLHQIRGRVGRSSRRASAFFTFKRGKQLTEIAVNRLSAIREFTEFGSGFKIAMRDLELRGAGNILGAQQHGHLQSVGYDMYLKLLAQAVGDARGQAPPEAEKECLIDLPINAHIPENYISGLPQKLAMYRRIADIKNKEDADDVLDELIDRFGDPPESVTGLINVALIRSYAIKHSIYEIVQRHRAIAMYSYDFDIGKINRLAQRMRGRVRIVPGDKPYFLVKTLTGESLLDLLIRVFGIFDSGKNEGDKLSLN